MIQKIGAAVIMIGLMMAESETILIPLAAIAAGAALVWAGGKLDGEEDSRY